MYLRKKIIPAKKLGRRTRGTTQIQRQRALLFLALTQPLRPFYTHTAFNGNSDAEIHPGRSRKGLSPRPSVSLKPLFLDYLHAFNVICFLIAYHYNILPRVCQYLSQKTLPKNCPFIYILIILYTMHNP